jgi:hypothetical protein
MRLVRQVNFFTPEDEIGHVAIYSPLLVLSIFKLAAGEVSQFDKVVVYTAKNRNIIRAMY